MRLNSQLLLLSLFFVLFACKQEVEVPAYIQVKETSLITNVANQDSSSVAVQDIWLYQKGDLIGTFEVPLKVPVLNANSSEKYSFLGGVWENSNIVSHKTYPFWKPYVIDSTLLEGKTHLIKPVFQYYPDSILTYGFLEDFEDVGVSLTKYNANLMDTAQIFRTSEDAFNGNSCGKVRFDSTHRALEVVSSNEFVVTNRYSEIWLEITYKGDLGFRAGVVQITNTESKVFAPNLFVDYTKNWKTVYVNLSPTVYSAPADARFKFYFATNANGLDRELRLDNIKILYFKPN